MNLYTFTLFLHVVGAVGVVAGFGTWLFGCAALWRAGRVETVREVAALMAWSGNVVVASIVLLGAAGIAMALMAWGGARTPWIDVATGGFLLLAPLGAFTIDPRVRAIASQARKAPDGPLPAALARRARDPVMTAGLLFDLAALLGILYLMTTKPPLEMSIVAMLLAFALGLLAGVPLWLSAARVHASQPPAGK